VGVGVVDPPPPHPVTRVRNTIANRRKVMLNRARVIFCLNAAQRRALYSGTPFRTQAEHAGNNPIAELLQDQMSGGDLGI
jgi:hypothetical protein